MDELDQKTRNIRFLQACIGGEIEKINLLLDEKKLNVDMYFKDSKGSDGFRSACYYKREEVVKELLFKYDYKISKRNFNYVNKLNYNLKGEIDHILKMIESKKISSFLDKSLNVKNTKSKQKKI